MTRQAGTATLSRGEREHIRVAAGLSMAEAAELLPLAEEASFATYVTPGVPSASADVKVVLLVRGAWDPAAYPTPLLHLGLDNWKTVRDVAGSVRPRVRDLAGVPELFFVFGLGPLGGDRADWAYKFSDSFWLNRGGQNYGLRWPAPAPLSYVGDLWLAVSGLQVPASGASVPAGQEATVYAQSHPASPGHSLTLLYTTDGLDTVQGVPMVLDALQTGPYGNNVQRAASVILPQGSGTLAYRVRGGDGTNTLWAPDGGGSDTLSWSPAPGTGWLSAGRYAFSECYWIDGQCQTGWFWVPGLPDPLDLTPQSFQAYAEAPAPGVEVYVPGLTDVYRDGRAQGLLRVEVVSPFFGGAPAAPWTAHPLRFRETAGHNYRYAWDVREFRVAGLPAIGVNDPPAGRYSYKFRVSTDGGATWHWLGTDPWPGEGDNRGFDWALQP